MNTKDRILNAAERLFARDGFEATSLRAITAEAQVNLAAVNYHFQSKDALVQAVIGRRMGPVNAQRLALLDAYESEAASQPLPLEKVMDAFLRPIVALVGSHAHEFVPLIGRIYVEPGEFAERLYTQQFEPMRQRFFPALQRALPDLPLDELAWRLHFSIGALAHTMAASKILELMSRGRCNISDVEATLARLKAFVMAGLTAPVSVEVHHAAH
ncbi:MAG TPA: TetR/AcrR family transcriptional regulator [Bryobacteraceae bacterium]|jgi:AcrR family transcriptional regulator|nr:TetR/AcrR family transcriptional regulator [Bryobacteraceae bacterium]